MPSDTITLRLSGDVFLDDYFIAIRQFRSLVGALSKDVARGVEIEWRIDSLETGSAAATLAGLAKKEERQSVVEEVVRAYERVGVSMEKGLDIPYSQEVIDAARGITNVLNGRIDEILFETDDTESIITSAAAPPDVPPRTAFYSYGAIEGRVQTLSSRTALKFTLYDVFGRGIQCYLQEGDKDMMRDAWDKWVVVEGRIRRDALGQPISIRQISNVVIRPQPKPGSWRRARGAAPVGPDALLPEEAIRRLRDA